MGWIKNMSLKKSLFAITTIYIVVAIILGILFSTFCNVLIDNMGLSITVPVSESNFNNVKDRLPEESVMVITDTGEAQSAYYYTYTIEPGYTILSALQVVMPVVFVIMALILADIFYYRLKLKHPIEILRTSAERIQKQDLDFEIAGDGTDELGELCAAFEIMRKTLLLNNRQLWRQGEERKRLNAAFSHDLRNPVTVLKGAAKLLQKEVDNGTLSADNGRDNVELISQYAGRIEHYVESMTSAQKLEELECKRYTYEKEKIQSQLQKSLTILAEGSSKQIEIIHSGTAKQVHIDKQFVSNTAENLISNALRYAQNKVSIEISYQEKQLFLAVWDDGSGVPAEMLKKGIAPFSHNKMVDNQDEHFGMGLYICKLLCKKHGGDLVIENMEQGAKVTAKFCY